MFRKLSYFGDGAGIAAHNRIALARRSRRAVSILRLLGGWIALITHRGHRLGTENGRRSLLTVRCIAYYSVELLISLIMDAVK